VRLIPTAWNANEQEAEMGECGDRAVLRGASRADLTPESRPSRSTARLSGRGETGTPDSLVSSIAPMRHRGSNRSRWLVALSVLLVGLVVVMAIAAALAPTLLPAGDQMGGEGRRVAAGVIFAGGEHWNSSSGGAGAAQTCSPYGN
jgi:hypothetical protein